MTRCSWKLATLAAAFFVAAAAATAFADPGALGVVARETTGRRLSSNALNLVSRDGGGASAAAGNPTSTNGAMKDGVASGSASAGRATGAASG